MSHTSCESWITRIFSYLCNTEFFLHHLLYVCASAVSRSLYLAIFRVAYRVATIRKIPMGPCPSLYKKALHKYVTNPKKSRNLSKSLFLPDTDIVCISICVCMICAINKHAPLYTSYTLTAIRPLSMASWICGGRARPINVGWNSATHT